MKTSTESTGDSLALWLRCKIHLNHPEIVSMPDDAGHRRYFRVTDGNASYVAAYYPSQQRGEITNFVNLAKKLSSSKVRVPDIIASDPIQGWILQEDLGGNTLLSISEAMDNETVYCAAIDELIKLQSVCCANLPSYDQTLLIQEMILFSDWFLHRHLHIRNHSLFAALDGDYQEIAQRTTKQPQVFVHRDYHSKNLILDQSNHIAMVDFQDAVTGPWTYDLASLLEDSYITIPAKCVDSCLKYYWLRMGAQMQLSDFVKDFQLMGIQRHIKVAGIFARLHYRDGKSCYLPYIPDTIAYIKQNIGKFPSLSAIREALSLCANHPALHP